jgi:ERCC4-type nuclease
MKICIDYRESKLIPLIKNLVKSTESKFEIIVTEENLDIGDIKIYDNNESLLLIIERKSVADLASSITDGRYSEQSFRLNSHSLHNHNITYLIEGSIDNFKSYSRIDKSALYSSIFTLQYYKGFSVYNTKDVEQTATYIYKITTKLFREKNKLGFYNGNSDKFNNQSYCDVKTNLTKKSEITPDNIGEIMLMQIPSVSAVTAKVIMNEFKTILNLIADLQENEHCLDDLHIMTSKLQKRKINKSSIQNIKAFLLQ